MSNYEIASAYVQLYPKMGTFQSTIKNTLSNMDFSVDLSSQGKQISESLGSSITSGVTKAASTVTTALGSIGGALGSLAATGGVSRALNIEKAQTMFKGLNLQWSDFESTIQSAVDGTAFTMDAAALSAAQLAAAGVAAGDDMATALNGAVGVSATFGAELSDIGSIYSKVAAQGKVSGEILTQFSDRGINATSILASYLNKTGAEVKQLVSDGEIDFDTFSKAMYAAFGDSASAANETFTGSLANMKSALNKIGQNFATPFIQACIPVFNAVRLALNQVRASIDPVVEGFTKIVNVVSDALVSKLNAFTEAMANGEGILGGMQAAFGAIGGVIATVASAFAGLGAAAGAITVVTSAVPGLSAALGSLLGGAGVAGLISGFSKVGSVLSAVVSPVGLLTAAFAGLAAVFIGELNSKQWFADDMAEIANTISGQLLPIVNLAESAFQTFSTEIQAAFASLSTAAAPVARDLAVLIGTFAAAIAPLITQLVGGLLPVISEILVGVVNLAATLLDSALPVIDEIFAHLTANMPTVQGAVASVVYEFLEFAQTVWPLLQSVLTAAAPLLAEVVTAGAQVAANYASLIPVALSLVETITPIIASLASGLMPVLSSIISILPSINTMLVSTIIPVISNITNSIQQNMPAIQSTISSVMSKIQQLIDTVWPHIQNIIQAALTVIAAVVNDVWPAIENVISGVMNTIMAVIDTVMAVISGDWDGAWNGICNIVSSVWDTICSVISGVATAIGSIIVSFLSDAMSSMNEGWNNVAELVSSIPDKIAGFFSDAGNLLVNAGSQIISGLLSGITGAIDGVYNFVSGIGATIASLKGPKSYDLALLVPAGHWIMSGLQTGLEDGFEDVSDTVSDMGSSIASSMWENGYSAAINYSEGIEAASSTVSSVASSVATSAETAVEDAVADSDAEFQAYLDKMLASYEKRAYEVKQVASDLYSTVWQTLGSIVGTDVYKNWIKPATGSVYDDVMLLQQNGYTVDSYWQAQIDWSDKLLERQEKMAENAKDGNYDEVWDSSTLRDYEAWETLTSSISNDLSDISRYWDLATVKNDLITGQNSADEMSAALVNLRNRGITVSEDFVEAFANGSDEYQSVLLDMANMTDDEVNTIVESYNDLARAQKLQALEERSLWVNSLSTINSAGQSIVDWYLDFRDTCLDVKEAIAGDSGLADAFAVAGMAVEDVASEIRGMNVTMEEFEGYISDFSSAVSNGFSQMSAYGKTSFDEWRENLQVNMAESQAWAKNVATVFNQIPDEIDSEAFRQAVYEGGFDQWGAVMADMATMSAEEIAQAVELYNEAILEGQQSAIEAFAAISPGDAYMNELVSGIESNQENLNSAMEESADCAIELLATYEDDFYDTGSQLANGIAEGIQSQIASIASAAASVVAAAIAAAKAEAEIASPSKVMDREVGQMLGAGTVRGIEKSRDAVEDAMSSLVEPPKSLNYTTDWFATPNYEAQPANLYNTSTVNISANVRSENDIRKLAKEITRIQNRSIAAGGYA
jgi:tape measure domain-containing protein